MIYGGQEFVNEIRSGFLGDKKDFELPQHNQLLKSIDPAILLERASKLIDFDVDSAQGIGRIPSNDKEKRDALVYLQWKTGRLSNREVGSCFGLRYSSVSKIVSVFHKKIRVDKVLKGRFDDLHSQFTV